MKVSELKQLIREEIQNVLQENPIGGGFGGDIPKNSLDSLVKRLKDKGIDFKWSLKKDFINVGEFQVNYSNGNYIVHTKTGKKTYTSPQSNSESVKIDDVINHLTWKKK